MNTKQWLLDAVVRVCVCSVLVALFVGTIAGVCRAVFQKLLDPYGYGIVSGVLAIGMAIVYVVLHRMIADQWLAKLIYLTALSMWCGQLWIWAHEPSGRCGTPQVMCFMLFTFFASSGYLAFAILAVWDFIRRPIHFDAPIGQNPAVH
ncbi:MAG: hypothetical protein SGJ20_05785 [Planctomycetota bacterium]|nr:hypothetical protein [Planctomycetota bacterium]